LKKLISISFLTILLLAGSVTGTPVNGTRNILYVDDDNIEGPWDGTLEHPFRYIQDAVDNASTDDTVRVFAGEYEGPKSNVCISKTVSIIGNGSVDTFVDRSVSILADQVLFRGFTVNGYDYETMKKTCCIKVIESDLCNINNNTIASGLSGIELYDSHNNIIENSTIVERENGKPNIYLFSSNTNMIRRNHIDSNSYGIYLDHCRENIIDDNNFENEGTAVTIYSSNNNTISGNTIIAYHGVVVRSSDCNTIIDNDISNNFDGIVLEDSSFYNTITRNNICNNINSLYVDGSHNIVSGNIISNNLRGLYLGDSSLYNIISDNNISSNNEYGGIHACGSDNIISNNTISHNGDGILCNLFSSIEMNSNNYTITGNAIISNNGIGIKLENCSFYTLIGNTISHNENGINLIGTRNSIISGNIISSNNNNGILLYPFIWRYSGDPDWNHFPFKNNQIMRNIISNNGGNGIWLGTEFKYLFKSRNNTIGENNIINNKRDAFIVNAFFSRWQHNYWNNARVLPKPISGIFQRDYNTIEIPWFNIDWRPALRPYDIS
jgi:parallel beta-helix repeat protein